MMNVKIWAEMDISFLMQLGLDELSSILLDKANLLGKIDLLEVLGMGASGSVVFVCLFHFSNCLKNTFAFSRFLELKIKITVNIDSRMFNGVNINTKLR